MCCVCKCCCVVGVLLCGCDGVRLCGVVVLLAYCCAAVMVCGCVVLLLCWCVVVVLLCGVADSFWLYGCVVGLSLGWFVVVSL